MEQFYTELKYPVWQFAKDTGIDKTLTEAIKYTTRYLDKSLEEDKIKATEYLDSLIKLGEYYPCNWYKRANLSYIHQYVDQLPETSRKTLNLLIQGYFKDVKETIDPPVYDPEASNKEYLTHCSTCQQSVILITLR